MAWWQTRSVEPDAAVEPLNRLHAQLLRLVAEANALEDTMDVLREEFEQRRLALKEYLTEMRALSREQFRQRALIDKISRALAAAARSSDAAAAAASGAAAPGPLPMGPMGGPGAMPPSYGAAMMTPGAAYAPGLPSYLAGAPRPAPPAYGVYG